MLRDEGGSAYTRLVSNSAPVWSSRCCFAACHFKFGKSLGRNAIRIEPDYKQAQLEMSPIGNEPCVHPPAGLHIPCGRMLPCLQEPRFSQVPLQTKDKRKTKKQTIRHKQRLVAWVLLVLPWLLKRVLEVRWRQHVHITNNTCFSFWGLRSPKLVNVSAFGIFDSQNWWTCTSSCTLRDTQY